jgi:hypothetical protein
MNDINPNNSKNKEVVGIKVIDLINLSIEAKQNILIGTSKSLVMITPVGIYGAINALGNKHAK